MPNLRIFSVLYSAKWSLFLWFQQFVFVRNLKAGFGPNESNFHLLTPLNIVFHSTKVKSGQSCLVFERTLTFCNFVCKKCLKLVLDFSTRIYTVNFLVFVTSAIRFWDLKFCSALRARLLKMVDWYLGLTKRVPHATTESLSRQGKKYCKKNNQQIFSSPKSNWI